MFCSNCGMKNDEGAAYCVNCGRPLETTLAGSQNSIPQTAPYVPPYLQTTQGVRMQDTPYAPYGVPKKKRTGLIAGIAAGGVVIIAAVILIVLLNGSSPVNGTWYCEERGVVLEFRNDSIVVSRTADGRDEGNYTFDGSRREGVIIADDEEYAFSLKGKKISVDDVGEFKKAGDSFDLEEFLDGDSG